MPRKYEIAVLPGDGVGPEVIREALRVLEASGVLTGLNLETTAYNAGARYWLAKGRREREWDEETFEKCSKADAILLGPIGLPDVVRKDGRPVGGDVVFGLRKGLDVYANVRPVKLMDGVKSPLAMKGPKDIDFVIVRENTEGLYSGIQGILSRGGGDETGVDVRLITRKGAERIINYAFRLSMRRNGAPIDRKRRVTCVDKSNVLAGCRLFRSIFNEFAGKYPRIQKDYAYVDAICQWLIRGPEKYDVIVTTNLFGDILSEIGAALQGGLGLAPSANVGEVHGMFEPVHGSAPRYAGKNVANPTAAILSAMMMLEWLAEKRNDKQLDAAARLINEAVVQSLGKGEMWTQDLGGKTSTRQAGQAVVRNMRLIAHKEA
jgi:3-isopropylmalate dehydrogenase